MITVLVDHNIEGQAGLLERALVSEGWVEMAVLRIVTFADVALPTETSDQRSGNSRRNTRWSY